MTSTRRGKQECLCTNKWADKVSLCYVKMRALITMTMMTDGEGVLEPWQYVTSGQGESLLCQDEGAENYDHDDGRKGALEPRQLATAGPPRAGVLQLC